MSHIDYILLQPTQFDKNIIVKCVPDEASLGLIDGAIAGKFNQLKASAKFNNKKFANYNPKILAQFSLNEQFYILAHTNLTNLKIKEPNPAFTDLVYTLIRNILIT